MQNPFESGHIRNYILLYASVVVIMVLFFIATSLFHETKSLEKKVFQSTPTQQNSQKSFEEEELKEEQESRFKLLEKGY